MKSGENLVLPFTKMQSLGNDFIILHAENFLQTKLGHNILQHWSILAEILAQKLCQRNFSIGADGLILAIDVKNPALVPLLNSLYNPIQQASWQNCDLAWTYTNSDGSPSQMCGNGLRCLALWAQKHTPGKNIIKIFTGAGSKEAIFKQNDNGEIWIEVVIGEPSFKAGSIPFRSILCEDIAVDTELLRYPLKVNNLNDKSQETEFIFTGVNVGNPHCVIFQKETPIPATDRKRLSAKALFSPELGALAAQIETAPNFPEGTNVEFAYCRGQNHVETIVWERGCGPTYACGSGAAAVVCAGISEGHLNRHEPTLVEQPGGMLSVIWSESSNQVSVAGQAAFSFTGEVELPWIGDWIGKKKSELLTTVNRENVSV